MKKSTIMSTVYAAAYALLSGASITDREEAILEAFYSILRERLNEADWAALEEIISK